MTDVQQFIQHLSERPWSEYTAADYTVEQWHNSCLIHQHVGPPTSKGQCKLPVKTPNGAVNRNAVHSAAAALAGARGGVHASSDEKASAAKKLISLYHEMDEKPPPSLLTHSDLEHYGTKGMRWGVRRSGGSEGSGVSKLRAKIKSTLDDPVFRENAKRRFIESKGTRKRTQYRRSAKALSNDELKKRIERMDLERRYNDLNTGKVKDGKQKADGIIKKSGSKTLGKIITESMNLAASEAFGRSSSPMLKKLGPRL